VLSRRTRACVWHAKGRLLYVAAAKESRRTSPSDAKSIQLLTSSPSPSPLCLSALLRNPAPAPGSRPQRPKCSSRRLGLGSGLGPGSETSPMLWRPGEPIASIVLTHCRYQRRRHRLRNAM